MLRSSINASRLIVPRPFIRPCTDPHPRQILASSCIRQGPPSLIGGGRRCMAVAANANPTDAAPLITPGTPVSTPTLIDIDKRWLELNAQQQLDIFKALHEREREPWYTMTTEERKALYFINFGPHGPRAQRRKDGWEIFGGVVSCIAVSFVLFWAIRQYIAAPPPRTMTREWQEATNRRFKELGIEPISGPGADDYKGKGMVYGDFVNRKSQAVPHEEEE